MKKKLTKIVATIGPASDSEEKIQKLIKAGVNVFRFNTKHSSPEWHQERIKRVQKIADKLNHPIGILLDLQGPELRIESIEEKPVKVEKDQEITISLSSEEAVDRLYLPQPAAFGILKKGDLVLIDDGYVEGVVTETNQKLFKIKIKADGVIKHKKGVNFPGKNIKLPSLIESDLKELDMASINKVDFMGLSFVRCAKDIEMLKKEMEKRKIDAQIVAKIESLPALENLKEIVEASDSIMIARGDLGIETPIEQLAYWQKKMIKICREKKKPVITATQMLESMINNSRPTRAEATDVANAVLDGTDAVMLSAETAAGNYPVRSVEFMAKIAKYNERRQEIKSLIKQFHCDSTTDQVITAAVSTIHNQTDKKIDEIIIFTETGNTAKNVSRYRLNTPIIAVTDRQKTVETLTLSYGIFPLKCKFPTGKIQDPTKMLEKLTKKGLIEKGKNVLIIHGKHWKTPGLTNSLSLHTT